MAAVTTLRGWLDHLAAHDRLAVIRPGVDLRHELAAISKRLDGDRASFFPAPGGHDIAVVSGLLGARSWIAEAMDVPGGEVLARFANAAANPLPWREVTTAPVQEIVHEQVDMLAQLPIPTHNELDSGPYISAGLMISRNPRTGVQNVSIHRCQVSGPDELGVLLLPRHTNEFFEMAERDNQPLEIAIVIGADPLTTLASQAIVPIDHDELEIAGALHGAPLEVVRCTSNQVRVPANAEIVLEGRISALAVGHASTFWGRKKAFIVMGVLRLILLPLCFIGMARAHGDIAAISALAMLLTFLGNGGYAPLLIFLNERFPTALRSTGTGLSWNIGFAIGGMMPTFVSLASPTPASLPHVLSVFLLVISVIFLAGGCIIPETYKNELSSW